MSAERIGAKSDENDATILLGLEGNRVEQRLKRKRVARHLPVSHSEKQPQGLPVAHCSVYGYLGCIQKTIYIVLTAYGGRC
jgi:hypothetical protein